jgi:RHS repeat-associated protein
MLGDEQGSTNVMMPVTVQTDGTLAKATLADAAASTRTSYTPYGELRGTVDNTATDRGWLGQVEDRVVGTGASSTGTGLTYLNARYYDPATSRFISPDPLMNPGDPKTLDPYRYADNNPVVFTDATGLQAIGQYDCAGAGCNVTNHGTVQATPKPPLRPNVFAPFAPRWNPGPLTLPGSPPNPDGMAAWTAERDRVDANLNGSPLRDMTVNGILNQWATSGNHAAYVPWLIPGVGPALRPVFANDHRDANGGLAFQDGSYYSDLLRANRHLQTVVREGIYKGANGVGDSGATFSSETKSLAGPVADASYVADPTRLESPAGAEAILGSYNVDYSILATESRSDGQWVQARVVVSDTMTLASATRLPGVSTADQQKRIAPAEPYIPGYKDMPISAEFTEWFNVG